MSASLKRQSGTGLAGHLSGHRPRAEEGVRVADRGGRHIADGGVVGGTIEGVVARGGVAGSRLVPGSELLTGFAAGDGGLDSPNLLRVDAGDGEGYVLEGVALNKNLGTHAGVDSRAHAIQKEGPRLVMSWKL